MKAKPVSIDDYLSRVEEPRRSVLEALRKSILTEVRGATEVISYGMPAFRTEAGIVAGVLATTKGCSYFPFSGTTLATLANELRGYSQTKSALHFTPDAPLPKTLLRKLLKARLAEMHTPAAKPKPARVRKPKRAAARRTTR